ncbi:hypothetical protein CEXT_145331 [Caerostris extrusa]|uniref:Endonuclease/exonuclease/phosphatase domain-containing protein n=1 Tax=Caerostris extrusa TaxID=172846 RepID=A0AAV4PUG4_CAEEX|nr:hypothetical protein CEXT_145331 [Caerostris extrusa]
MNVFKIAQQNLQHSKAATLLFIKLLEEKDFSIACVQEPYITNEHIPEDVALTSTYSSPSEDLDSTLQDYSSTIPMNTHQIICGDFNAHSTTWGYNSEDQRGKLLMDFISFRQLFLVNPQDSQPTFIRSGAVGWPDLHYVVPPYSRKLMAGQHKTWT